MLFLAVPLFEIYLLIEVGSVIGAIPTVFMVVFTAVLGTMLLQAQGISTLRRVQEATARGEVPAVEMLEGFFLIIGGILLLIPGFFTDIIGFLCLIPSSRQAIIRYILARSSVQTGFGAQSTSWQSKQSHQQQPPGAESPETKRPKVGRTIEGDYRRED